MRLSDAQIYGSLLFLDMTEAVMILYDRGSTLQHCLDKLKDQLEALGSQRVQKGGGDHWLLKPDLKPGEDFTL
jgi:hypothetical protein